MGDPKIANWQNVNSRLAQESLVGCFTGTVIETSFILFSYRHPAKYSSLFTKSPEFPVFIGIPRGEEFAATLHHSSPIPKTNRRKLQRKTARRP